MMCDFPTAMKAITGPDYLFLCLRKNSDRPVVPLHAWCQSTYIEAAHLSDR